MTLPPPSSPGALPILNHRDAIGEALRLHQTIIVAGDTGSGKTTQLPQFCLELLGEGKKNIGCTQPRRVAAVSVAERVAEEIAEKGGMRGLVGYKIRFHDQTSPDTRIKFMTDGVLLAETRSDPLLRQYGVIIIDEAHERSLNIDFLLGFLKNLLPRRPDLKLIITSATIDTAIFSRHFDNAPVITIAGRAYPVTVRYVPYDEELLNEKEDYIDRCVQVVSDLHRQEGARDTLIFLPTEQDIRTCCALLSGKMPEAVILPMFGRLQSGDQRRIFQSFKQCKIVVATNVAETSITVPGIRFVVDAGLARISQYNVRAKTLSLPVTKISRASCDQRQGRCGRVGPGICVRLYSEEDYLSREEFTVPEIKRANLAEVILQMIAFHLGDPHTFPFVEPPMNNAIRDGYKLLTELGAIDGQGKLTPHGQIMATLPIDPCIARIILAARENNCLREIKVIAAALAIADPRVRPAQREQEAAAAHRVFAHPASDFLALLTIWDRFQSVQDQVKSWSRLKKFCASHFLSFQRMREWLDLHNQLDRLLTLRPGFTDNSDAASFAAIHQSLCAGFLRNIAMKSQKPKDLSYTGAGGLELMIFPGSCLARGQGSQQKTGASEQDQKKMPVTSNQWIMAASFLETTRLYAMTVAAIDQEWLEPLGGTLCRKSWSHPRWHKKSGQVIADEKVTLFGLVIVASRKVNFGRIDPDRQKEARQIFIQEALLTGEIENPFPFLQKNLTLLAEWQETEERLRKRDIVADDLVLFAFYDQRLPLSVYDRFTLHRFLQKLKEKQALEMTEADILNRRPEHQELSDFPPLLTVGSQQFRLEYNFSPGAKDDGVTVRLPLTLIETLRESSFEWLVPGLLREKVTALLRGLPKNIRKHLIPLGSAVDLLLDDIEPYKGSLPQALERSILKAFNRNVVRADWPTELPAHLSMRFLVFDQAGVEMATGRSLATLRKELLQGQAVASAGTPFHLSSQHQKIKKIWEEKLCPTWDFEGLPSSLPLLSPQGEPCGLLFPALKPARDRGGVMIEFIPHQKEAVSRNSEGLNFLYQLQEANQYPTLKKYCVSSLSAPSSTWLAQGLGDRAQALGALLSFIMRTLFHTGNGHIPDQETFQKIVSKVRQQGLFVAGRAICDTVMATLRQRRELGAHIHRFADLARKNRSFARPRFDEYQQLMLEILPVNFLTHFELAEVQGCGLQIKALMIRIERAFVDPAKDALKAARLQPHLQNLHRLQTLEKDLPAEAVNEIKKYREMIAHYRITVFAPEIQGKIQVSAKKLEQQWQELTRHIAITSR